MMEAIQACTLEHCYRETNKLVDELANMVTNERIVELDVGNLSIVCNEIIENDKRGKMYERVK